MSGWITAQNPAVGFFTNVEPALVILGDTFAVVAADLFFSERPELGFSEAVGQWNQIRRVCVCEKLNAIHGSAAVIDSKHLTGLRNHEA